ncbi:pyridoxamine 5-phosphate oxidase [Grimontia sp. AD028]|uniref:Pyridoxamine 5-phosphate oxidase n=2 Tax=Grimontia TaxID=246861 RepID=R1J0K1_9GAMM|nr:MULTISPECIES: DUF3283 family protein [Grimontia]EOD81160.1 hypothetical protein D515_04061 [Grimontia indica]KKD58022.1 pyridoxamine 5-phosphate oxidase [Grimontia sp. AD028]NGN96517.1 DUF3283 family protein [Grimontia sedimenti]
MSHNLALLPPDEKQKIELDKQAAYSVWQVKNALAERSVLAQQARDISDENERAHFVDCVDKYSKIMGL